MKDHQFKTLNMVVDLLTQLGLTIGQLKVYLPLFFIGFFFFKPNRFAHVLILMCFTLIYNLWLKSIWQVPLPPTVGHEGWAFPSGHMHGSVIFWGWLALNTQSKAFKGLVISLLALHSFSLVQAGFHYPLDIVGSWCFGTVTLLIYKKALDYQPFKEKPALLGIALSALSLSLLNFIPELAIKSYLWQAQGILIGFSLGWLYLIQQNISLNLNLKTKLMQFSVTISGVFLILILFINAPTLSYGQLFIQYFLIGLMCALGKRWFTHTKQLT